MARLSMEGRATLQRRHVMQDMIQQSVGDDPESATSCELTVNDKNAIYRELAPRKKGRIYGIRCLQGEASSIPPHLRQDPTVFAEKLVVAEECIATQTTEMKHTKEKLQCYENYFTFFAEKFPKFRTMFNG